MTPLLIFILWFSPILYAILMVLLSIGIDRMLTLIAGSRNA